MVIVDGLVTEVNRYQGDKETMENVFVAAGRETLRVWGPAIPGHEPAEGERVTYRVTHTRGEAECSWRRLEVLE